MPTGFQSVFTAEERKELRLLYARLRHSLGDVVVYDDFRKIKNTVSNDALASLPRDRFGRHPLTHALATAGELCDRVSPDRSMTMAVMLYNLVKHGLMTRDKLLGEWGEDVGRLVDGLMKVAGLYSRQASVQSDNFRKLLLAFAEDIRVIIIMLVDRLVLMRAINHHPSEKLVAEVAMEANYLYAPLAHRLGLYQIKSELEDMSLKYTDRQKYTEIARKLNETKVARDAYIADFIKPVRERLEAEGLKFDIKGRTKSIYSIWNKMKKQHNDVEDIYDLFAIRVILDVPKEREKSACWLTYSLITDMYTPNPKRLKDWLSIPKSNGYESLHITVYGPGNKWVEVQIRTRRMDEIAEKGLAAHWKYKGIRSENSLDAWMANVRDILEAADSGPMELMKNLRMDVYDKEVFAFTPKGDLYRLPKGATLLDFAFNIHTGLGSRCTGGKVNGKNQKINYRLQSGDTVEIFTASAQVPKRDWLNYVVTAKARNKIRVALKEMDTRTSELGREMLQRRFKNRKLELDEGMLSRTVKKMGYKTVTDFYSALADESLDINHVVDTYVGLELKVAGEDSARVSASEYVMQPVADDQGRPVDSDILVIGDNIRGINYRLSKCCNPIFGDDVFGFVSSEGVIKIHRDDCPNAANIRRKYPYRVIRTRWSGRLGSQFGATLRIVGHDDIGIVTNITSIINKEKDVTLRNISIDSNDGLFQGFVVVGVNNTASLDALIRKLRTVKGVKDVSR
ncbi:MAG: RelA/SpoT family protein [Muribaculaceae bacterium]|nr:RelA/SpoT family protein [Muribaculaceae bacterium]MDE6331942.1 RelA/SpoT family protein [Muribaculaceae bacterium]